MRIQVEKTDVWNRKTNGAAIATDRKKKILYLLEFKRTTDQSELKRQYEDMVEALMEVGRNMAKGL